MFSHANAIKESSSHQAAGRVLRAKPEVESFSPEESLAPPQFNYRLESMRISAPKQGARLPAASAWPIQAKLEVGAVNDPLEREADRVAEYVMRMPEPAPVSSSASGEIVQRKCQSCADDEEQKKKHGEETHEKLARKESGGAAALDGTAAPSVVHEVLRSPGEPLDSATRAFFEPRFGHDFSHVRLHTDNSAAESTHAINAHAYTVGRDIVFDSGRYAPASAEGQRLIAHELTHVVQQAQRPDVGADGEAHEVVHLFQRQQVVLRQTLHGDKKGTAAAAQAKADAPYVLWVMDDIFKGYPRLINEAPSAYVAALRDLYTVKDAHGIPGRRLREMFDDAMRVLGPIMAYANADQRSEMAKIRSAVLSSEARDRIEHSFTDNKKVIEIPTDSHPREQAEVLRAYLPKLISTIHDIQERLLKLGEKEIEAVAEHMAEGHPGSGFGNTLGRLQELQAVLHLADGWLKLTDEEFRHELQHINGVFQRVKVYADLVKAVVEFGGGAVSFTATLASGLAKLTATFTKDTKLAASMSSVARSVGMKLGNVIAGIEIVHGAAMLFDPDSTRGERIEGGVEIAMGVDFLAGGASGTAVVALPYFFLKYLAFLGGLGRGAAIGLNYAFMQKMYVYMAEEGTFIAKEAAAVARAGMLEQDEKDPEKAAALAAEQKRRAIYLGQFIDEFLDSCKTVDSGDIFRNPGGWRIPKQAFAPILGKRGARTAPEVATAAAAVLDTITWCFANSDDILESSTRDMDLAEMMAKGREDIEIRLKALKTPIGSPEDIKILESNWSGWGGKHGLAKIGDLGANLELTVEAPGGSTHCEILAKGGNPIIPEESTYQDRLRWLFSEPSGFRWSEPGQEVVVLGDAMALGYFVQQKPVSELRSKESKESKE